jgi:hypothetical protein
VREYYEIINIVYLYPEKCYGSVENLGAYASVVKFNKDGEERHELFDNEDFVIVDEIVFTHAEEE